MSMRVVLPPKDTPFPKFCAELTSIVGTSWTRTLGERDGHIRLPRFRIETQADLSAPLKALGMSQVFDPARAALERHQRPQASLFNGRNAERFCRS